jgi:hypothetical protein
MKFIYHVFALMFIGMEHMGNGLNALLLKFYEGCKKAYEYWEYDRPAAKETEKFLTEFKAKHPEVDWHEVEK